jgi:beta-lactamase regulating signal transducer with metallopeptidase domain
MTTEVLTYVWRINLALAGVLAVMVLARTPVRRLSGSDAVYALWMLAIPASGLALLPAPGILAAQRWFSPPALPPHAITVWLAGVGVSVALLALGYVRLKVLARRGKAGPAVIGVIRPRLYLPADFAEQYSPAEQAVIRAHERAHLERNDAHANLIVTLVQTAFWFNPLVHLAAFLFRADQEMACDQQVMDVYPERRRLYAATMLKCQQAQWSSALSCAFGRHPLESRIAALVFRPSVLRQVTVRLILVFGFFGFLAAAEATYFLPSPVLVGAEMKHLRDGSFIEHPILVTQF